MFEVRIDKNARNFINKLDGSVQKRIIKKLDELSVNPEIGKPLTANLSGLWRLRIGDYRVIYQIRKLELVVLIVKVGHRKNVYD